MKLVSAQVAGPEIGLAPRTLLDLAARGQVRHWRFGRNVRFDIDTLLEDARVEPGDTLMDDDGAFDAEAAYQALVA